MILRKFKTKSYSVYLKDFYKQYSLLFEIYYKGYFHFIPNDFYHFDKQYFEANVIGYSNLLIKEHCGYYNEILHVISSFYPIDEYFILMGL